MPISFWKPFRYIYHDEASLCKKPVKAATLLTEKTQLQEISSRIIAVVVFDIIVFNSDLFKSSGQFSKNTDI